MTGEVFSKDRTGESVGQGASRRKVQPMDWVMMASLAVILGIFVYTSIFTKEYPVHVASVVRQYPYQIYTQYSAQGSVAAKRRVDVAAKVAGQLVEFSVEKGSQVAKGQVIALLESADAQALKDQAEARHRLAIANLEQARVDLAEEKFNIARFQKLFEMGSVSRAEYKSADAGYRKAQSVLDAAQALVKAEAAVLKSAEIALDYTRVRAPFGGMILSLNAYVGDVVTPFGPAGRTDSSVATIADVSELTVEVEVPVSGLAAVRQDQPCVIVINGLPDVHFTGEVSEVGLPAKGNPGSLVKVRIAGNDPRILPDTRAQVSFLSRPLSAGDDIPRVLVHSSVIVDAQDGPAVFLVKDDRAVLKKVRTGPRFQDRVEILGGVSEGDRLVANPPEGIENGSRLTVSL